MRSLIILLLTTLVILGGLFGLLELNKNEEIKPSVKSEDVSFLLDIINHKKSFSTNQTGVLAHYEPTDYVNITETNEAISDILDYGEKDCASHSKHFTFGVIDFGDNRYQEVYDKIQHMAVEIDAVFNHSAFVNGGGERHVNFERDAECKLVVRYFKIPKEWGLTAETLQTALFADLDNTNAIMSENLGANNKLIMISNFSFCGYASLYPDDRKEENNNENNTTSIFVDYDCLYYNIVAHEMSHSLGAVQPSAPFSFPGYHCYDQHDIMCRDIRLFVSPICDDKKFYYTLLDCSGDSYYNTGDSSDYLNTHRNIADSGYLHE